MRRLLLVPTLLTALGGTAALGAQPGFQECGMVGTWYGVGDSGTTWWATASPGSIPLVGELTMEWVAMDPTLGGFFPDAVRVTRATGVWRQVGYKTWEYTWIAHGLDATGAIVYTARASGTHTRVDCSHMNITYVLEIWLGLPNMATDPPIWCAPGGATETRMPLVQAACQ